MTGTESKWQSQLGFTSPKYVESEVLGTTHRFYPISVAVMSKVRTVAKPIAKAVSVLFGNDKTDQAETTRQVVSDQMIKTTDADGKTVEATGQDVEIIREAIDPKLAKMRSDEKREAVDGVLFGLMEDSNLQVIAEIIMDSMRDVFSTPDTTPPPSEFLKETPVPALFQMVKGVIAANAGVVGPMQGKLKGLVDAAVAKAMATVEANVAGDPDENEPDKNQEA